MKFNLIGFFMATILPTMANAAPFGRTQKWNVLDTTKLPNDLQNLDTTTWTPIIKKIKNACLGVFLEI